jgi:hypothetical protein
MEVARVEEVLQKHCIQGPANVDPHALIPLSDVGHLRLSSHHDMTRKICQTRQHMAAYWGFDAYFTLDTQRLRTSR